MKGIYLVTYSADCVTTRPNLRNVKVEADTFLAVEDWADSNCPEGYGLWSIEKVYFSGAEDMFGETEVTL